MHRLSSIWRHSRPFSFLASSRVPFSGYKSIRGTHLVVQPRTASTASYMYKLPQPHIQDPTDHKMTLTTDVTLETFGNFDLLRRVKLDYTDVEISRWRSRVTGLNIVHLDFDGECILQHWGVTLVLTL